VLTLNKNSSRIGDTDCGINYQCVSLFLGRPRPCLTRGFLLSVSLRDGAGSEPSSATWRGREGLVEPPPVVGLAGLELEVELEL
jgi:hypothetical protein